MAFLSERLISAGAKEDPVDDDFKFTTLLIHADGSNGGTNNQSGVSILDSSDEGHTVIDPNAAVFPGTFSPFSAEEGKWSALFSAGEFFEFDSSDFAFGTGDFTIELWFYYDTFSYGLFSGGTPSSQVIGPALSPYNQGQGWQIYHGSSETNLNDTGLDDLNGTWVHVAYVRASNVVNVYQNGVKVTSDISDSTNYTNDEFTIGYYYSKSYDFEGYMSNFRVVKGTAVYTSNFTVPTAPLTAITNTKLLTFCSNRFRDKSTSGHALLHSQSSAVNPMNSTNHPQARPFSPFAPSNAYSASTHGGSCYFTQTDNSEIYVSDGTDFDFGTGDYTIEMWAYPIKTSFNNSWSMAINTTGVNQYWAWTDGAGNANAAGLSTSVSGGYSVDFADIPEPFQWSHIVFQNTSGVANWYLNGTRIYNTTHNENFSASATGLHIGNSPHYTGQFQYGGYLSDIRVVKGGNAYTNGSTITVPTAPLTKITNTKLLLNFTQAAIIDQTGKTNMRTAGAVNIETSAKKFGTGSIEFDGTADFIDISDRSVVPPSGLQNWTVECFVYINSHKNYNNIYCAGPYIQMYLNSSGKLATWIANASLSFPVNNFQSTNAISTSTWTHVALVRNGNTYTYYIDGTANGTASDSTSIPLLSETNASYLHLIGAYYDGSYSMNGYIDEFRITKKARYTSNFTAPTEAFLDK